MEQHDNPPEESVEKATSEKKASRLVKIYVALVLFSILPWALYALLFQHDLSDAVLLVGMIMTLASILFGPFVLGFLWAIGPARKKKLIVGVLLLFSILLPIGSVLAYEAQEEEFITCACMHMPSDASS